MLNQVISCLIFVCYLHVYNFQPVPLHDTIHARIQKVLSRGSNVFFISFLQLMRGTKYYDKWAIIGLPAKCHQMAFRWRADDGPTLNAGLVALGFFRGSGPVLLRNPIFL